MAEVVTELPLAAAANLRGSGEAFVAGVAQAIGAPPPLEPNRFVEAGGITIAWLGPDEWLVIDPAGDGPTLEARLHNVSEAAATDVTGNRVALRLSGPAARDLLAAGCSLDLHSRAFAAGQCAQTLLARTGVILLQRDDAPTFDLLVRRSFARYLRDWLASVAALA